MDIVQALLMEQIALLEEKVRILEEQVHDFPRRLTNQKKIGKLQILAAFEERWQNLGKNIMSEGGVKEDDYVIMALIRDLINEVGNDV